MFRFQMRKKGSNANVKSVIIAHALYRKVRAIMISMGTQNPSLGALEVNRVQKKLIGVHCRSVTKKNTSPVNTDKPTAQ
jgi:hypothetical protein